MYVFIGWGGGGGGGVKLQSLVQNLGQITFRMSPTKQNKFNTINVHKCNMEVTTDRRILGML